MNTFNNSPSKSIILPLLAVALCAYIIPWVVHPTTALTLGAYDLAEWVSLRPDLDTSLLLRSQLLVLTLIFAFLIPKARFTLIWWIGTIIALALVIAQLPPLDFFRSASGDPNYQQQFVLAVGSFIGVGIILTGVFEKFRSVIIPILSGIGLIAAFFGIMSATSHLDQFSISVEIGFGFRLLVLCYISIALVCLLGKKTTR